MDQKSYTQVKKIFENFSIEDVDETYVALSTTKRTLIERKSVHYQL